MVSCSSLSIGSKGDEDSAVPRSWCADNENVIKALQQATQDLATKTEESGYGTFVGGVKEGDKNAGHYCPYMFSKDNGEIHAPANISDSTGTGVHAKDLSVDSINEFDPKGLEEKLGKPEDIAVYSLYYRFGSAAGDRLESAIPTPTYPITSVPTIEFKKRK